MNTRARMLASGDSCQALPLIPCMRASPPPSSTAALSSFAQPLSSLSPLRFYSACARFCSAYTLFCSVCASVALRAHVPRQALGRMVGSDARGAPPSPLLYAHGYEAAVEGREDAISELTSAHTSFHSLHNSVLFIVLGVLNPLQVCRVAAGALPRFPSAPGLAAA
eukprot:330441-Chlamydomonas_euryale.AAC.1